MNPAILDVKPLGNTSKPEGLRELVGTGKIHWRRDRLPIPVFLGLVAQLVNNPPAIQETWVRSLGWEDPLEKGKAIHPSILA